MTWTSPHVFSYAEILTSANLNGNFAQLSEMAAAKFTAKGQILAATGANAGAVVSVASAKNGYGLIYDSSQSMGARYVAQRYIWDYNYTPVTIVSSNAENTIWSKTLTGSTLGSKGFLHLKAYFVIVNSTGSGQNVTIKFYIGATAISSGAYSIISGANTTVSMDVMVAPKNSSSAQYVGMIFSSGGTVYSDMTATMTSDNLIKLTAQLSASSSSLSIVTHGLEVSLGPDIA